MFRTFTLAMALAGGAASMAAAEFMLPARTVVTFPPETTLIQHSRPEMQPGTRAVWEENFLTSSFFSAFAISKTGGYGYATTANTPEAARAIAVAQCLRFNEQCRVIAEIHPAGYTAPGPGEITIATEIAGYYDELLAQPAFRAMAINEEGAYATAWGYATQEQANQLALEDCNGYRSTDLPGLMDMPCILLPLGK